MLKMISGGRIPKQQQQSRSPQPKEPLTPKQARKRILNHQGFDGMRILGHLDLSGASHLYDLPNNLSCESLDLSDCVNLSRLPEGLHVTYWIEVAGSGLTHLESGHGFILRWRGVPISDRAMVNPDSITGQEILNTDNVELRRVLIERLGYEKFLQQVGGIIRDRDQDAGGERQLIAVPFEDDEPLMVLKVICPSTGHLHLLRVPPDMETCYQAAAWVAGFNNPDLYQPAIET
ncbi:MAG: hypothetical protein GVY17_09530 [Cyanobacteria bacterium]|jgi:hypothetical protein|nr:hypothetical protein [Cyanobacteria bacterium GSL.Bin21]